MRSSKLAGLMAVVILVSLGSVGLATPTVYNNDFAGFAADNGAVLLEDFESIVPKDAEQLSFTHNGVTYTGMQASNPNVWVASPGYDNFGGVALTTSSILTSNENEDFLVNLGANANRAVGFDIYLNGLGPVSLTLYRADSTIIEAYSVSTGSPTGATGFLGFAASEPIHSFRWTSIGGDQVNTGIDNLYVGTVPAPGAILLGTLGAGLVGWLRRRQAL